MTQFYIRIRYKVIDNGPMKSFSNMVKYVGGHRVPLTDGKKGCRSGVVTLNS